MMVNAIFAIKKSDFYSKIDKKNKFDWINIHKDKTKIKKTGITKGDLFQFFIFKNKTEA